MAKKKATNNPAIATAISIAFTTDEISWLAWIMRYEISTLSIDAIGENARDKILEANDLLQQVADLTGSERKSYEKVKAGKLDQRKRTTAGPRRKSSSRRSK